MRVGILTSLKSGGSEHEVPRHAQCTQSRQYMLCGGLCVPYHLGPPRAPGLCRSGEWKPSGRGSTSKPGFQGTHATPAQVPDAYFSLLARRRYSPTVMAFFWMLYCVKRPDWPVTTCWMGAGMTTSSMSSYVCRGFHSFGGMICKTEGESEVPPDRHIRAGQGAEQRTHSSLLGDQQPLPEKHTQNSLYQTPKGPGASNVGTVSCT